MRGLDRYGCAETEGGAAITFGFVQGCQIAMATAAAKPTSKTMPIAGNEAGGSDSGPEGGLGMGDRSVPLPG
jgi:hypothetical protein